MRELVIFTLATWAATGLIVVVIGGTASIVIWVLDLGIRLYDWWKSGRSAAGERT